MGGLNELITKFGANIYFVSFLNRKNGLTIKSLDGYLIFVNEHLCRKKMIETVEHELWHIILGHLDDQKELTEEEKELEVKINMNKIKNDRPSIW